MEQKTTKTENVNEILNLIGFKAVALRQNIAGQLLIDAKINDVAGTYILDTGAGTSVVDSKLSENLKLKLNIDEAELTGGGLGGHGIENVPSHNNVIEIGNIRIDSVSVAVMPLTSAWESLASIGANDELSGFIGIDVLKSGNGIIEISTMTLYLKQP